MKSVFHKDCSDGKGVFTILAQDAFQEKYEPGQVDYIAYQFVYEIVLELFEGDLKKIMAEYIKERIKVEATTKDIGNINIKMKKELIKHIINQTPLKEYHLLSEKDKETLIKKVSIDEFKKLTDKEKIMHILIQLKLTAGILENLRSNYREDTGFIDSMANSYGKPIGQIHHSLGTALSSIATTLMVFCNTIPSYCKENIGIVFIQLKGGIENPEIAPSKENVALMLTRIYGQ